MSSKPLVVFLVGPTASGKSAVAIELADLINAEIISADSMQIYRGLDILSAKLTKSERQRVRHHLIDILEPTQEYNAALFRLDALKKIKEIIKQKHISLIVGGTGLYIRTLIQGIFSDKGKDELLRQRLYKQAEEKGSLYIYEQLKRIDPKTAKNIDPHNVRRIVRAIEVYEMNKIPLSQLKTKIEPLDKYYRIKVFAIQRPRYELYQRIEERVDWMFKMKAIEEVKRLKVLTLSKTAKQALGIKQIGEYLEGKLTQEQVIAKLKRDSRRYAKRQLTWFRKEKDITWINAMPDLSAKDIACQIKAHLS